MSGSERFTVADARRYGEKAAELPLANAGVELDFSVESLARVDELMAGWHDDGHTSEGMPTTVYLFGCYFGEVIIRNHGGTWRETAGTEDEERVGFPVALELPSGMICNPLGKASKLLDNGLEDSLLFFCRVVTAIKKS
jgi:hypothetical protein